MIYFIVSANQFVKIGCSDNPGERLKSLQIANPKKLWIEATMSGSFKTEAELHRIFSASCKNGEWFKYAGHLRHCIKAINDISVPIEVTDIRSFQQAGLWLHLKGKAKRLGNNHKLTKRICTYDSLYVQPLVS